MPSITVRTWLIALSFPPFSAIAQEPTPFRREASETIAVSQNNLGLQNRIEIAWRRPLRSPANATDPLRKDAHISVGVSQAATPSYMRVGGFVEIAPLSILQVRVGAEPSMYFGTFHSLMSFDRYGDAFDVDARSARPDRAGFGTAFRAYVEPKVQMKLGSFIVVAAADLEWWRSSAKGPLFYEPERDTLLAAAGDRMMTTSSVLLYERHFASGGTLTGGLVHNLTWVPAASANRVQRVGAVFVRQFRGRRFGLNAPYVAGYVSRYLDDRSKKGQFGSALALSFRLGG